MKEKLHLPRRPRFRLNLLFEQRLRFPMAAAAQEDIGQVGGRIWLLILDPLREGQRFLRPAKLDVQLDQSFSQDPFGSGIRGQDSLIGSHRAGFVSSLFGRLGLKFQAREVSGRSRHPHGADEQDQHPEARAKSTVKVRRRGCGRSLHVHSYWFPATAS